MPTLKITYAPRPGRPPSRAQPAAVMESNQACFATPQWSCRSVAGSFAEILPMGLAWTTSVATVQSTIEQ